MGIPKLLVFTLITLSMVLAGCLEKLPPTAKNPAASIAGGETSITGTGPVDADGVSYSVISITLQDADGYVLEGFRPRFSASDTRGGNIYGQCTITDSNGFSQCTLKSTGAEVKTLQITYPEVFVGGTVEFVADVATKLNFLVQPSSYVVAGQAMAQSPVVEVTDPQGNPIDQAASITLSAFLDPSCTISAVGTLTADNNPVSTGGTSAATFSGVRYTKWEDLYIKASTPGLTSACSSLVEVRQVIDTVASTIVGTNTIADGVDTSTITITLQDVSANPVYGVVPTFSATDTGSANVYGVCSATNAGGVSTCSLTSTKAETKTLSVLTPTAITESDVIFDHGPAVSANTTVTGTTNVVADNVDFSTITITLLDANNNPVDAITPVFDATGTNNTLSGCSVTDVSGISTCTLKSTKAEDKTLSISFPFNKVGDIVTFINGPLTKLNFSTSPSPDAYTDIDFDDQPVVEALDAFDNPITTTSVSITLAPFSNAACSVNASGALSATTNPLSTTAGVATFSGVQHSLAETIYVRAQSGGITECSSQVVVIDRPDLAFDVETYAETSANVGSTTDAIVVTLTNDTFTGANGSNFVAAGKISVTNLPAGMTAVANKDSGTQLTITLTGNAANHANSDDVNNLGFEFADTAFNIVPADRVVNYNKSDFIIDFIDPYTLSYASSKFDEVIANTGATDTTIVLTLDGTTFTGVVSNDFVVSGKASVTNLPAGMIMVATKDSDTQITLSITGNAVSHGDTDDVANLTVDFADSAFASGAAAGVVDASKNDLEVDFFDTSLDYGDTTFNERVESDGAIDNTITITLTGDTFATPLNGTNVNVTNVPAGLTADITRDNDTTMTLSLSGNATNHYDVDDVSDLTVTFLDAAFVNNTSASNVTNYLKNDLSVDYTGPPTLSYDANTLNEAVANDGSCSEFLLITLIDDIFVADITGTITASNVPAGMSAVFTRNSDTEIKVELSGNATNHLASDSISNLTITFLDSAFTYTSTASDITNYDKSDISVDFNDPPELAYDANVFYEVANNDGSSTTTLTITVSDDTYAASIAGKINASNVPTGLSAEFVRDSDTEISMQLSGNATAHTSADNISNLTVTFLDGAFVNTATAADMINYQKTDIAVEYLGPASLTYDPTTFDERFENDGAIDNSVTVVVTNEIFAAGFSGANVNVTNIPAGLSASWVRDSDTNVTLSLTGNATAHADANDVSDLTITFLDGAFANIPTASDVTDYQKSDLIVDFDNPVAILVGAISGNTKEDGTTADFTVVLDAQPIADVTVAFSSSNTAEGTVVSPLTFTDLNWDTPQVVTVTGVDDLVSDGNQNYDIVFDPATSTDVRYDGIVADTVAVINEDDDIPGITVSEISGDVSETGESATFSVVLDCLPTDDVTIGISSDDTGEGTVLPASLTFTNANGTTPQVVTVTGVDDAVMDGLQTFTIVTAAASSADTNYDGIDPNDVPVNNIDDDGAPGIEVSAISSSVSEAGNSATFTIVLLTQPTGDVVIDLSSSDTGEGTIDLSSLTFTSTDWFTAQTVTVTGVDDVLQDGSQGFSIITDAAVSTDGDYNGVDPENVLVTNLDDDTWGITVSDISGDTSEDGTTATFTIVLNSAPTADVVIDLSSSDTGEASVNPTSYTFTAANWSSPQTVTVTGVDDALEDGDQSLSITFDPTTSTDTNYDGISLENVSLTNLDDDSMGFTISELTENTSETGTTASFTVRLKSPPTADVTINVSSDDTGEGTVSASSLTFTPGNWSSTQEIEITGVDDALLDGSQSYNIILGAATSTDTNYDGIDPLDLSLLNLDDDSPSINVNPVAGLITTEAGGEATFEVTLGSAPTADVTVNLSSSDTGEATVSPASLTFTPTDWASIRTIVVTGVDDALVDGNISFTIVLAAATSADPQYDGIDPTDVIGVNNDDETPGFEILPSDNLSISEDLTTSSFTVRLLSPPTDDVVLPLTSSDTGEGTITVSFLTFTAANWNSTQTVVVTGVDDALQDGTQVFTITTGAALSSDGNYDGLNPADVDVENLDNDTPGFTFSPLLGPQDELQTSEDGDTDNFSVVLNTAPTADVTLDFNSNDSSEGSVDKTSLTFTPANWNTPQTVVITGLDDGSWDGDRTYRIQFQNSSSADPAYNGINNSDIKVRNIDNEWGSFVISPEPSGIPTLFVSENATIDTFTIVLSDAPSSDVTFDVYSDDTTELAVNPTTITFTPANWNAPQTVTVQGVDDAIVDGDQEDKIKFTKAVSGDWMYNNRRPSDIRVLNTDND